MPTGRITVKKRVFFQAKAPGCTTRPCARLLFWTFQSRHLFHPPRHTHTHTLVKALNKYIGTDFPLPGALCHWRESSRGQEWERMSRFWTAWSKSRGCWLTKTSMQPLYGADTSVDTRGTPESGRWQHVSMSSQLTYDPMGGVKKTPKKRKTGQHIEYVRLSKKKTRKRETSTTFSQASCFSRRTFEINHRLCLNMTTLK